MKLSPLAIISKDKLINYLLLYKKRNDKSKWLKQVGYGFGNWGILEYDLRGQILPLDAILIENSLYGNMYEIKGVLYGPNNRFIKVCTIWMIENGSGQTKFITMYPDKN